MKVYPRMHDCMEGKHLTKQGKEELGRNGQQQHRDDFGLKTLVYLITMTSSLFALVSIIVLLHMSYA
jgi:hypothetical protein